MENSAKKILKVLIYIEDHIHDELTVEELAKVACYSPFHFQRIFQFIVGQSVHQYIRRLRMERAMAKLQSSDQSITDIALDAGFQTPSAFTKAFKQCMGRSPRNYRLLYKEMNMAEKKISDLAMIQPDEIKNVPEIPVLFIRKTGAYEAWDAMKAFIKEHKLNEKKLRHFHIAHDNPRITNKDKLRYDACVEDPNIPVNGDVEHQILPVGKYAIFTSTPDTLVEAYDRIFLKWFPDSNENYDIIRINYCEFVDGKIKIYIPLV